MKLPRNQTGGFKPARLTLSTYDQTIPYNKLNAKDKRQ